MTCKETDVLGKINREFMVTVFGGPASNESINCQTCKLCKVNWSVMYGIHIISVWLKARCR